MSLCDTCPKPGNCCKDFTLHDGKHSAGFPENDWENQATAFLERHGLPFKPLRIAETRDDNHPGLVGVRYMCPNLTPEGRCGDYENRPRLCRDYEAGSDRLCALYAEPAEAEKESTA